MKVLNYLIVNLFLFYQRFKTKLNRRVSRNFSKITSSDISLTLSDQGVGPPLLLLHGITQDASAFDPLIRHLKSRFKIIALDRRGHGANAKPKKSKIMKGVWPTTSRACLLSYPDPIQAPQQ